MNSKLGKSILLLSLLAFFVLAGCVSQTPASSPTPTATQLPSATATQRASVEVPPLFNESERPSPIPSIAAPSSQSIAIEADDKGFYPSEASVKKGDLVTLVFKARTANIYAKGIQVKADDGSFTTPTIAPGGTYQLSFIASKSFSFTSYWPDNGVKKATGKITVS